MRIWAASLLLVTACTCGKPSAPQISASPDTIDFGANRPGTKTDRVLRISNGGTAPLAISDAHLENDARSAFSLGTAPASIPAGADATLQLFYTAPAAEGADTATLSITSNAGPLSVPLAGSSSEGCAIGLTFCSVACVDLSLDLQHCGRCDNACSSGQQCDNGQCACAPTSCAFLGKNCGELSDGCGGTQSCGSCAGPLVCGGGDTANVCGVGRVCTEDRWCWDAPTPTGNELFGVDVLSPNDLWAVGAHGSALHFDGARWTGFPTGTTRTLRGVWMRAANDVWAVGDHGTLLHFDGARWSAAQSPTTQDVNGVAGGIAVGAGGTILKLGGDTWTALTSPTSSTLYATDGTYAVGANGTALYFDGTTWTALSTTVTQSLFAVRSGIAVGAGGVIAQVTPTAVTPLPFAAFEDLHGVLDAGTALLLVGSAGDIFSKTTTFDTAFTAPFALDALAKDIAVGGGIVQQADGGWAVTSRQPSAATLRGIGGSAPTDLWAVGDDTLRNDDGGWRLIADAGGFNAVWSPVPFDAFAVGAAGTIARWGNDAWTPVQSPTNADLYDIQGLVTGIAWASGKGVLLAYDRTNWSTLPLPAAANDAGLNSVWAAPQGDVYVVGDDGLVLHAVGDGGFNVEPSGTAATLAKVRGAGTDVWAVGANATVLHRVDGGWLAVSLPGAPGDLRSLMVVNASDVWVAGDSLLHFDGQSWRPINSGADVPFNHIWGTGADTLWLVGPAGTILRYRP